jgi:hypothetical protein
MNSSISISFTGWANRFSRLARLLTLLALALVLASNPELHAQNAVRFTYVTNQNAITITGYSGAGGAVTIPSKLNGFPVTRIGDRAFNRAGLTQINLPNTLTSIGEYAFYGCWGLSQITLPDALTSIGGGAFSGCTGLTQITFPANLTVIGAVAFDGCRGLSQITLPDSLTIIGAEAFFGCTGLSQLTLPNSLTIIGEGAFYDCRGLTQISLPDSLTSIEEYAFSGCTGLTQIRFPDSLTSIGGHAFSGCTGLALVTLPDSLNTIGDSAFIDCPNLRFARFLGNAPSSEGHPFGGDALVLYLPGATGWSDTYGGAPTTLWLPAIGRPTTAGGPPDGRLSFPVEWAPEREVTVEACANLSRPDWQPVGTLTLDATGTAQFSDPDSTLAPARFYRLRAP